MKPAGTLLLLSVGLVTSAPAAAPADGIISREISAKIREGLPAFTPPAPAPAGEADSATQTTDPNVLILPKLIVKEKRLPADAADQLMSRRDFKRKMENIYLDEIAKDGPLNYLLNSFTIPLLSPSKAARGHSIYRQRELDRLRNVIDAGSTLDPGARQKYEQEMDNTWTTRPAGGLEKR
ncbi:hypothetical protein Verru16b_00131 [Lacunisphaera limnophila]|uniref:Uncharacterized protein n=1 Tax=Lacunisphaera limnophila TaxID=1838286 RepID=A0A1I7PHK5_9BACT|nr:hypothetical protein [Lacunisphaera limnophila]AOS43090.1 hypothetical protein Verru16b_00131 [Lacunisphaera limnophila]